MSWEYVSIPGIVVSLAIFWLITHFHYKLIDESGWAENDTPGTKFMLIQVWSPLFWPFWALGMFSLDFLGIVEPKVEYSFWMGLEGFFIACLATVLAIAVNIAIRLFPGFLIGLSTYEWFINDFNLSPFSYLRDPIEWIISGWLVVPPPEIFGWQVELLLFTQISLIFIYTISGYLNSDNYV